MKSFRLSNGKNIPAMGFGTYKAEAQEGFDAIQTALKQGYRLIDTAAKYENEETVGKAIRASKIPRENIMLTSKIWRDDLGYTATKKAAEASLNRLQLDYLDFMLIHWPANGKNFANWKNLNQETWKALEELVDSGKIKAIGLSNFWPEHLLPILEIARIKPVINQLEFHPGYRQQEVIDFCKLHHIQVQAWSPLARGKVFKNTVLNDIAQQHNKSVAQICLRWIFQQGIIPIPKSAKPERIQENQSIFDFELSPSEMKKIDALPTMGFSGELPTLWPDRL